MVEKIQTKELCFDDICLNKDVVKELLEKNGLSGTPSGDVETNSITSSRQPVSEGEVAGENTDKEIENSNQQLGNLEVEPSATSDVPAVEPSSPSALVEE